MQAVVLVRQPCILLLRLAQSCLQGCDVRLGLDDRLLQHPHVGLLAQPTLLGRLPGSVSLQRCLPKVYQYTSESSTDQESGGAWVYDSCALAKVHWDRGKAELTVDVLLSRGPWPS